MLGVLGARQLALPGGAEQPTLHASAAFQTHAPPPERGLVDRMAYREAYAIMYVGMAPEPGHERTLACPIAAGIAP